MQVGWYSCEFSCWAASEVAGFSLTELQEIAGISSSFYEQAGQAGSRVYKVISKSVEEYITSNRGVSDSVETEVKLLINNYITSCFFFYLLFIFIKWMFYFSLYDFFFFAFLLLICM